MLSLHFISNLNKISLPVLFSPLDRPQCVTLQVFNLRRFWNIYARHRGAGFWNEICLCSKFQRKWQIWTWIHFKCTYRKTLWKRFCLLFQEKKKLQASFVHLRSFSQIKKKKQHWLDRQNVHHRRRHAQKVMSAATEPRHTVHPLKDTLN